MVFDGGDTHTNAADVRGHEAIALTDLRLHVLSEKYGFDLRARTPIAPAMERVSAA
jgi:hypothetical protein